MNKAIWTTILILGSVSIAEETPLEYRVKAAFIVNFAKFTEWPEKVFTKPNSPLVFGVFGENPFGDALQNTIANKKINNRFLVVKYFSTLNDLKNSDSVHVLFVSNEDEDLERFASKNNILLVGDRFGDIIFTTENKNIRFKVNLGLVKKSGLKLSSELLKLAKEIL